MAQIQALRQDRFNLETQLREVLARRNVSKQLTTRIKKRLAYNQTTMMRSDVQIIDRLPRDLAIDLLSESRSPIVEHHDYFFLLGYRCPRVLRQLCHDAMDEDICQPQQLVFSAGDICPDMYFVEKGELQYLKAEVTHFGTVTVDRTNSRLSKLSLSSTDVVEGLERKSSICEPALWLTWSYQGSLMSVTPAHVLTINAEKFGQVIKQFHFAHVNSARYAQTFLARMLHLGQYSDMTPPDWRDNV